MKRVVYSNITKTIVFLIGLVSVFAATCVAGEFLANHLEDYADYTLDSAGVQASRPARDIVTSARAYVDEGDYADDDASDGETRMDPEETEKYLKSEISCILSNYPAGTIDYYIEIGGIKLDSGKKLSDYSKAKYHYIFDNTSSSVTFDNTLESYISAPMGDAKIYAAVSDEYAKETEAAVEQYRSEFDDIVGNVVFLLVTGLAALIYLLCVCGRKYGDTEIHMMLIDRLFVEVTLVLAAAIAIGFTLLTVSIIIEDAPGSGTGMIFAAACIEACAAAAVAAAAMSVVRNMKNRTFLKRSIICRAVLLVWSWIKKLWRLIKRIAHTLKASVKRLTAEKTGMAAAAALIAYTAVVLIFNVAGAVIAFAAACVVLAVRLKDFDAVKKGAAQIRGGNLSYKIGTLKSAGYNELANDIDQISEGMVSSVEERVKAERMKTELITNVSHDLKTPLTSIINYTKLLTEMDLKPEEAADYVKIIEKKSNRLKKLTADLFDISKVQSGNEEIKLERLDTGLLISQTLGEQDREIKESSLEFIVKAEDGIFIMADGRKMSRVMSNLVNNILKYAMRGTRVYITSETRGGDAVIELKNISSYKMDFDDDEITERFVRGDSSRTEEGNGLGLAIAKSYTEACGGSFKVKTDGDLFKVILKFKAVE